MSNVQNHIVRTRYWHAMLTLCFPRTRNNVTWGKYWPLLRELNLSLNTGGQLLFICKYVYICGQLLSESLLVMAKLKNIICFEHRIENLLFF